MLLKPHGNDRANLVNANPCLRGFNLRFLVRNANQIGSWWASVRALPETGRNRGDPDARALVRRDISAYPRSHILRAIRTHLDADLIRVFPEFLVTVAFSDQFHISDTERAAIRSMQAEITSTIQDRSPSTILARLATERRMSNRVISNAAVLAARVGRLRLDQLND